MKKKGKLSVDETICYLNTDLDLVSAQDLTKLAAALKKKGLFTLHCGLQEDGNWHATLELLDQHAEPETGIAAMLKAVESLSKPLWTVWFACKQREFNIGYDCGTKPWAFNQGLSNSLLNRIAAAGAALRITLYPPSVDAGRK